MNRKIIFIAGGALAVVLLIVGVIFLLTGGFKQPLVVRLSVGDPVASAASPDTETTVAAPTATPIVPRPDPASLPPGSGIMIDLGSKVINLADPGGYRYLRVALVLEFAPSDLAYYKAKGEEKKKFETEVTDRVTAQRAILDDAVIGLLSSKTFADIFSLQGKEDLKSELCGVLNEQLADLQVLRVYFTDFLVQ